MAQSKKNQMLLMAARSGNLYRVKQLLSQGHDPDAGNTATTPLHEAVENGHLDIVKVLVKAGADINKTDRAGRTPFDVAMDRDFDDDPRAPGIMRYLKSKGGKPASQIRTAGIGKKSSVPTSRKARLVSGGKGWDDDDAADETNDVAEKKKEPAFKAETLKDVFNPNSWIGKTEQMEKLWQDVPERLKEKFDFAAALAEAQRQSMRRQFPAAKNILKK